jgi:hypothetical protein
MRTDISHAAPMMWLQTPSCGGPRSTSHSLPLDLFSLNFFSLWVLPVVRSTETASNRLHFASYLLSTCSAEKVHEERLGDDFSTRM